MLREERRIKIVEYINRKGFVSNNVLAKEFDTTIQTIISDINYLEKQDLIIKVYGGAKSVLINTFELSLAEKTKLNLKAKKTIGKKAANLVNNGDRIFIDAGTTTTWMCEELVNKRISIVTNGFLIAKELLELGIDFTLIGGTIRPETGAIAGSLALENIDKFTFDKAFIGANGIDSEYIYTTQIDEAILKKKVIANSHKTYVLADRTKFNTISTIKVVPKDWIEIISEQ